MISDPALPPGLREQLAACGPADLVVGIPSLNNAGTIGHVVRAVEAGLARFFPEARAVIVDVDGGSADGTPEAALVAALDPRLALLPAHPEHPVLRLATPYPGVPGKGSALRTVFAAAQALEARACAVVEADLRSIQPAWMELLLAPVLREGFDFVAPLYQRHRYDGMVNTSIVYPLTRSLYGRRIRHPVGGECGLSARLVRHYLEQEVWETDVARFGIDPWMTTTALTGGFQVCQAFLGAKIHDAKDPALNSVLQDVVGAVFGLMESRAEMWKEVRGSSAVPLFGLDYAVGQEPVRVDTARMIRAFRRGARELEEIWRVVAGPEACQELGRMGIWDPGRFYFPTDLWIHLLHSFALAYHRRTMDRGHLLQALTPLYLGQAASYVAETREAAWEAVEEMQERVCLRFEALKPELAGRWD